VATIASIFFLLLKCLNYCGYVNYTGMYNFKLWIFSNLNYAFNLNNKDNLHYKRFNFSPCTKKALNVTRLAIVKKYVWITFFNESWNVCESLSGIEELFYMKNGWDLIFCYLVRRMLFPCCYCLTFIFVVYIPSYIRDVMACLEN